jgi:tripeptidyl-peptidase-1
MKSVVFTAALAAFFALCDAVPTPSTYALHEKRTAIPRLWSRGDRVERDAILPIRVGLTQSNLENAEEHLMDV